MKAELEGLDVPARADSGHDLYEKARVLFVDGEIPAAKQAEYDALLAKQEALYDSAIRSANVSWKTVIDRILPDSRISTGEAVSQAPGAAPVGTTRPEMEPSAGRISTAGRPSQEKVAETSAQSKSRIVGASGDSIAKDTKSIYGDDPQMAQMIQDDVLEAQRLMDDLGDLEIPGEMRVDAETAEIRTEAQSLRQAFDDLDAEDRMIDDMFTCMEG